MSKKPRTHQNSRNKSRNRQEQWTPITANPFLNFFLTKCGVEGNSKLHKFAKAVSHEWTNMNYHEKSPYYQLADKARRKRLKLSTKSGRKKEKMREKVKFMIKKTKPNENEAVSSKQKGPGSSHFEKDPQFDMQIANPTTKVLENWLAVTEFPVPNGQIEKKLLGEETWQSPKVGSTHLSLATNCYSDVNLGLNLE